MPAIPEHRDFGRYEKSQRLMYDAITASVGQLLADTSVEVVIPSNGDPGPARATELCDSLDLTRDGYHLSLESGTLHGSLHLVPVARGPGFRDERRGKRMPLEGTPHALTEREAELCREAARRACIRRFSVWNGTPDRRNPCCGTVRAADIWRNAENPLSLRRIEIIPIMQDLTNGRCGWCGTDELYVKYHDEEWGEPVTDDRTLFEFLVLEERPGRIELDNDPPQARRGIARLSAISTPNGWPE